MKNDKLIIVVFSFGKQIEIISNFSFFIFIKDWGGSVAENVSVNKSFDFAIRIVKVYQYLTKEKKEFILSKQLLRCGTSIGANVSEAQFGQSRADFYAKMQIALKEAGETRYWIQLLYRTGYLSSKQFESLFKDIEELICILSTICKTAPPKGA